MAFRSNHKRTIAEYLVSNAGRDAPDWVARVLYNLGPDVLPSPSAAQLHALRQWFEEVGPAPRETAESDDGLANTGVFSVDSGALELAAGRRSGGGRS